MPQTIPEPLPLEGTGNTRELGGYRTVGGGRTVPGRFLRSDGLQELTGEDNRSLYEYGVRCVLDLRSELEVGQQPDALQEGFVYRRFPLIDHIQSDNMAGLLPATMEEMYCSLLDGSGDTLAAIFREMLRYPGDCVLFHCTAGKDRTGVVSMLLLALAGVDEDTIVADYAATEALMKEKFNRQRAKLRTLMGIEVPEYVGWSRPESMERTLRHLRERYGGAKAYLIRIGLSEEECCRLRRQMLEE